MPKHNFAQFDVVDDHTFDRSLDQMEREGVVIREAILCADSAMALIQVDVAWDNMAAWTMLLGRRDLQLLQ